ncbi:hypothetical protein [Mesorhizobium sp. M1E.F.Ca.ET.063.01.1.1]|uniref:hypothetical protein n=1 Tax=Mesorhizobium sp. M1E.F.Ca.ET.063.01.1.1 TaxID=2496750 RepID=UPI000FC9B6B7|nr:hypothetical protein [Mesorhizobium sp. M1E.F.Ca.ET.063.01.1.1]RUW86123.1 hypothetical protein EOA29_01735 [Mesorhizobium sp. M1E.F.Ca.ET.063.01.1.1]
MNNKPANSEFQSGSSSSAASWDLRHPGLLMKDGDREVHEFTGMWPLKPDADLVKFTNTLAFHEFWNPPELNFAKATTLLGLIRAARWFVGTSTEFGPTLYFVSQFDSSLNKYFDDFVLNGRENLAAIWGQCIGCPTGPDATARDIVQYIARGQIKTLACYDAFPSLSNSQIEKQADWYTKTQNFQRAVAKGAGKIEDLVDTFLSELAKPYEHVRSAAAIDTDVAHQPQYTDVPERLGVKKAA